jgi:tRNA(Ile)-lysidine synthase
MGWRIGLVTVDHQLQAGSAERASAVAEWARSAGLAPVVVETVEVQGRQGGPEAAARDARYEALIEAAKANQADHVLLGHTMDDQAETVLLALVRGAGLRGLAGMSAVRILQGVTLGRPLLGVNRSQVRAACAALGLTPWEDPHNTDPAFTRTRARALLGSLVDSLGPSVVPNLARTAEQAAAGAAVLDAVAEEALGRAAAGDGGLRIDVLAALAPAVRDRALHAWARSLGVAGSALSHRHVVALDALVTNWHGQGPVHLPGAVTVVRRGGGLHRS